MAHLGRHAIVIGASISGLLAARALVDHYDEVTLIERDAPPLACEPRKGVRRMTGRRFPPPWSVEELDVNENPIALRGAEIIIDRKK